MINFVEFPNPSFVREKMRLLDGVWEFSFDGMTWQKINVPFCPQSQLSGIGFTGFIYKCFYKKSFNLDSFTDNIILNFGAVDYRTRVYVNENFVGEHIGGYTQFSFDVTDFVKVGENIIELRVSDDESNIPFGKQSYKEESFGCFYTRTTGIWQSVWLEFAPKNRIDNFKFYPNVEKCKVHVKSNVFGNGELKCTVSYQGKKVGEWIGFVNNTSEFEIKLSEKHLWEIGNGRIYDVTFEYCGDVVKSYFGLREVQYIGRYVYVNSDKVFQKAVMDQGFYREGIYTAPNAFVFREDIQRAIDLGFNCIRLHQKVFDPKYLYYCDVLGVMVWGEFPSWGIDYTTTDSLDSFKEQWRETIDRDFNHPSIVIWCPINEAWVDFFNKKPRVVEYIDEIYNFTKEYDTMRPCVDTSGGFHGHKTDLYDFHCYEEPEKLLGYLEKFQEEDVLDVPLLYMDDNLRYEAGMPVSLSEFGGIAFGVTKENDFVNPVNDGVQNTTSWGYGEKVLDGKKLIEKYKKLVEVIKKCNKLSGFCYTQLYDVEQEENGFFTYDRKPKLAETEMKVIREINSF